MEVKYIEGEGTWSKGGEEVGEEDSYDHKLSLRAKKKNKRGVGGSLVGGGKKRIIKGGKVRQGREDGAIEI